MFGFELTSVPLQFLRITFTYLAGFAIELGNSTIYKKTSWGIKSKQGGHLSTYGNLLQHILPNHIILMKSRYHGISKEPGEFWKNLSIVLLSRFSLHFSETFVLIH